MVKKLSTYIYGCTRKQNKTLLLVFCQRIRRRQKPEIRISTVVRNCGSLTCLQASELPPRFHERFHICKLAVIDTEPEQKTTATNKIVVVL